MTTLQHNSSADLHALRQSLHARLAEFARRVRAILLVQATAQWLAIAVGLALVSFALDRTLRLSHGTRRGLLVLVIAILVVEAWRRIVRPARLQLDSHVLAAALERTTRSPIAARVATVLEMSSPGDRTSSAMMHRAVLLAHESIASIDLPAQLDDRRRARALAMIGGTLLFVLALTLTFRASTRLWAARFIAGSDEPWPQKTYLAIAGLENNELIVPRGEPFALRVSARSGSVEPETVKVRWKQAGGSRTMALLTKFGTNDFRYDFPAVQSDVSAELVGGDDVVGPIRIHPIDRPRIVDLQLITQHPTEAQPRTHRFAANDETGDLAFLPLTQMELRFATNTPVAQARIKSSTTQPSGAEVQRTDDQHFALRWVQSSAAQLQIELVGAEAGLESIPTSVAIGLKVDQPPRATLGYVGVRQRITAQASVPLVLEARDDYGVDRMALNLKSEITDPNDPKKMKSSSTTQPIFPPGAATQPTATQPATTQPAAAPELDVRQPTTLDVAALNLQPGHLLTLWATAVDACYAGAQSGSSRQVTFRVVRSEELFRDILLRQQAERAKFRKQLDEALKLRETMNVPAAQEAIASMTRQHRAAQREVLRIRSALSDSLTEMKLNKLGTSEAHEMLEKLILAPLKSLDGELLTPQKDALESLKPNDASGLAAVVERQDQIVNTMRKILKQMSQWDSFIDVLNQLNEIIRLQDQAQQKTNQLKKSQADDVFDK